MKFGLFSNSSIIPINIKQNDIPKETQSFFQFQDAKKVFGWVRFSILEKT